MLPSNNENHDQNSAKTLEDLNQKIERKLDRLNNLVAEKRNVEFIKIEYKNYVEYVTQKYTILLHQLDLQKPHIPPQEFQQTKVTLEAEYKEDIISVAVIIDQLMEA